MLIDRGGPDNKRDAEKSITEMIAKYIVDMPKPAHLSAQANGVVEHDVVVMLTGSTGAVGSYILARLLADSRIAKVYTFNRQVNIPYDRQKASFVERELDTLLLESPKLVQLVGDLSQQYFGLDEAVFNEVCVFVLFKLKDMLTATSSLGPKHCDACASQRLESRLQPVPLVVRSSRRQHAEPHRLLLLPFSLGQAYLHFVHFSRPQVGCQPRTRTRGYHPWSRGGDWQRLRRIEVRG